MSIVKSTAKKGNIKSPKLLIACIVKSYKYIFVDRNKLSSIPINFVASSYKQRLGLI